ncbi:hypothetical protein JCGZ_18945 [Jatropha curcas]|uniref:Bet v I/Major latex protein domain-containing protein n=1 Tax=Jatropha curcas TaxID=180498 RepID=A0A067K6H6_JATCU|nr:major allergen Pru ar 1 [Jatropha curcas]KDP27865.1 hypothetical protein JCGZ_18945 [Jatropha curcas]
MGIVTYEGKIESSIPPARLFRMIILEPEIYVPKVLPGAITSFETLQGDGGPGTIRKMSFGNGSPISHVVETVDWLDKENCIFHYSIIGGDPTLIDTSKLEKMSFVLKLEPTPSGGTMATRSCKGYTVDGADVDEEEVRTSLIKTIEVFKGVFKLYEAYAIANPDA